MIQLRCNPGPTGRLLRQMLAERGLLSGPIEGIVNYGYGGPSTSYGVSTPTLNRRAGTFNKLQELEMLREKGVVTVPFSRSPMDLATPYVGRDLHHTRGEDIVLYRTHQRITFAHDFFTQLIPKIQEFRIWAFRRKVIGCYEKVLTYPARLGRRGRVREVWNYRNGYAYIFRRPETVLEDFKTLARQAVDAVGLDFGAVDLIVDSGGRGYVLEINSAPGVEGPRQGMASLVNHIERWAKGGFKRRNGEVNEHQT